MRRYGRIIILALGWVASGCGAAGQLWGQAGGYSVKVEKLELPKEINGAIASALAAEAVRVLDSKGQVLCEIWFRKSVPLAKSPSSPTAGYRDLAETTLLGVIRWVQPGSDYRKQKIKPGMYTLRLAYQPEDGDHMGTAPYTEFLLLCPVALDNKLSLFDTPKDLHELSAKATGSNHPAVFLLFPGKPVNQPEVRDHGTGHIVLHITLQAEQNGKTFALPVALTVIGHSAGA
ncbi:hypothetical protein HRbin36_01993 [bacterium HR36]|uniref:Hypothetical conserved protein n=1 Tax=uncultured Planctomycetota bacterium TaxID=120965 RepID=H5SDG1_9BACT|nr:hypothetical conserved protein [uncultured Planctomycetota bacterium]GBD36865.1 hypothetical protein HRbin36_01993 [bacterium HR36]